jgi:hypothetical protein
MKQYNVPLQIILFIPRFLSNASHRSLWHERTGIRDSKQDTFSECRGLHTGEIEISGLLQCVTASFSNW